MLALCCRGKLSHSLSSWTLSSLEPSWWQTITSDAFGQSTQEVSCLKLLSRTRNSASLSHESVRSRQGRARLLPKSELANVGGL